MIFHTQSVLTTDRLREIIEPSEADFPCTTLDSDLNLFSGRCSPWHWHDHFEFALVESGSMELQTHRGRAKLQAGDAYFVNSGVPHLCSSACADDAVRLHVHLFDRSIVSSSGLVYRRYVAPVEKAAAFEARIFRSDHPDDRALIGAIRAAFDAATANESGWEMEVSLQLAQAWLLMLHLTADERADAGADDREDSLRIKAMLGYIQEHYDQALSVAEIAAAAGVCERECFRCFARMLDTTPKAYLTKYRVGAAARMLSETGLSITEIAYRCGFANSSYFGKVFRQMLGCTPKEFRRA